MKEEGVSQSEGICVESESDKVQAGGSGAEEASGVAAGLCGNRSICDT